MTPSNAATTSAWVVCAASFRSGTWLTTCSSYAHSLFRDWARAAGFAEHRIPDVNGFVQQLKENQVVPGIHVRHTRSGNWLVGLTVRPMDRSAAEDGIEEVNPLARAGIDVN